MGLLPKLFPKPLRYRSGAHGRIACVALAAAGYALLAQPVRAQPQVTATFNQGGGFFNYNFTVRNPTVFTLAFVNINFPTGATATNLAAPTGFLNVFDPNANGPNNGIVTFLADANPATPQDFFGTSTVAGGTITSGFLLRSNVQLNGATFDALDENANSFSGTVTTTAVAAPEPGTIGLLAFGAGPAAGAILAFRRRFSPLASLKG